MENLKAKYGDLGAEIQAYIDSSVEEKVQTRLELLAEVSFYGSPNEEDYEWTTEELAKRAGCGRDMIHFYVHSGVLKGCFNKHGRNFKFKPRASMKAIEAHSEAQVYGGKQSENDSSSKTNIIKLRGRGAA